MNNTVRSTQSPLIHPWQGQQLNQSQSLSGLSNLSTTPTNMTHEDYSRDQLPMQASLIDLTLEERSNNNSNTIITHPPSLPLQQQQQQQQQHHPKPYHRPHSESSVFSSSSHQSKYIPPPTSYSNVSSPILNRQPPPIIYPKEIQNNYQPHHITRPHSTSGIRQHPNIHSFNGIVTQPSVVKHQQQLQYTEQQQNLLQKQHPIVVPDNEENKNSINNNHMNQNNNNNNNNNGQMYNNYQQQQQQQFHQHNNNNHNHNMNKNYNNNNNSNDRMRYEDTTDKYDICLGMLRSDVVTKNPLNLIKDELYEPVEMRYEGQREANYTFTITSKKNPGKFFGWVPFTDTRVLGPLASYNLVRWDVVIPRNKVNHSRTPLYIILYCQQSTYESICNILATHKLELKDPPFYNPACQYFNPKYNSKQRNKETIQLRKVSSLPSTPYHENNNITFIYNDGSSSSQTTTTTTTTMTAAMDGNIFTQSKQQIAQLLESIPTSLKKRNNDMTDDDDDDRVKEEDLNMNELTIKLLPHQCEGIKWMKDREANETSSGGILADDMGLGKTIQTIGLVVSGLSKEQEQEQQEQEQEQEQEQDNKMKKKKQTLIVAPLALINQWASEFKLKTIENCVNVLIHHGPQRTQDYREFEPYDVVITTYQMVASDMPSISGKKRKKQKQQQQSYIVISDDEDEDMLETSEGDTSAESSRVTSPKSIHEQPSSHDENNNNSNNNTTEFNPEYGPLFQIKWHRIVLDEAQQIKNHTTRVSIACSKLLATKRWCLTGTPIQNRVDELYSLFRFLQIKPLCQLSEFRRTISIPIQKGQMESALDRLKLVLMAIMLRRTKQVLSSDFSLTTDTSLSSSTTTTTTATTTTATTPTTTDDNTMMVTSDSTTPIESTSSSSMSQSLNLSLPSRQKQDILLSFAPSERTLYNLLTEKTTNAVKKIVSAGKGTNSFMNMLCMVLRLRQACNHPQLVLRSLTNDTDIMSLSSETGLIQLSKPRSSKRDTSEAALKKALMSQMASDLGWKNDQYSEQSSKTLCEICRSPIIVIDIDETNEPQYCSDCLHQLESIQIASQTASTKISKMLDILQETEQSHPNEKTIIFSQFTSMLDLMEKPLKEKAIKFCRYDGSMSNIAREKSLHALRTDPDCKVMLISLKCGSLGLNLTAANRVILMDIWWNPAVEEQAIDRVHRIGQSLPVHVTRLIIKDTIEQKIIRLQQQKAILVKGALGDQMINNTKLTYRELLSLFDIEK
ncbi:unnamed protein product [Cunninghamella echinulata]